jgi:hypothetical protein
MQYGVPILYDAGHLQGYLSSCFGSEMIHLAVDNCLLHECQTTPVTGNLISSVCVCKSVAAPVFPVDSSHVVLFCSGADSEDIIRHTSAQLLPGTR